MKQFCFYRRNREKSYKKGWMSFTTSCISCITRKERVSTYKLWIVKTVCNYSLAYWLSGRRNGLMVSALHSNSERAVWVRASDRGHGSSLGKTLHCHSASLHPSTCINVNTITYTNFAVISASGGDIIETAIELAPLDHDTSHSRKRVSCFSITSRGYLE